MLALDRHTELAGMLATASGPLPARTAFSTCSGADILLYIVANKSRTALHYCQRTTASWNCLFDIQRTRTELVWKSDMWFGDKALVLRATVADVIHYCQLGKLAVMTRRTLVHAR